MAMSVDGLATEIQSALGQSGQPLSDRNKSLAKGIVEEIQQNAKVLFVPGTVTGTAAPGTLAAGAASGGIISGVSGPTLAARLAAGLGEGPPTAQLLSLAASITTHLMTGQVSFAPGKITGADSNTPLNPGPTIGQGTGGKIAGLSGDGLAGLIAPSQGGTVSAQLKAMCGAIVSHIQKNAEVSLPPGSVTGVAPPGGGPLGMGAAVGGIIM